MKYIFVIPSISYRGGENIFISLAKHVKETGHDVVIIAGRKEEHALNIDSSIKVYYPKLAQFLLKNNFAFFLSSWIFQLFLIIKVGKRADWIITESNNSLFASALASIMLRVKVAWYVMHYETQESGNMLFSFFWKNIYLFIERQAVKRVKIVFALSEYTKKQLQRYFSKNIIILPPIIGRKSSYNLRDVRSDIKKVYEGRRVIFLPAVLHPKKNQRLAIEVLDRVKGKYRNLAIVFAGEGVYKQNLMAVIARKKLRQKVYFAGILSGDSLAYCYSKALVTFVCSSADNEGLSLTALESILHKTPVVVSSKAGVAKFLKDKNIGAVAKPEPEMFIKSLDKIISRSKDYKNNAALGKTLVEEFFSAKRILPIFFANL